ncbi:Leptomycin B resistance protein pmd1-like protein 7 [Phlyctema vagabunda]|uniref:Leptomycin B resistance protein pmd1-like protein 7 n=1 Tax=Phlyctema vagabunda TaxID=108571 RepID=A0ABR4P4M0_9HELO
MEKTNDATSSSHGSVHDDEPSGNKRGPPNPFIRIFHYADSLDMALNVVALISSIGAGVTLPLMTIVFGNSVGDFNTFSSASPDADSFRRQSLRNVLLFVYLFIAKLILTYISGISISISALRTTRTIRRAFLDSILRKAIWQYDEKDGPSVAILVTTNGERINKGISEKLAYVIQNFATFFAAFVVALAIQWKLALITMSCIPAIFLIIGICVPFDAVIESRIMRIYSKGGTIAQEAISTIRTVHAFWAQSKLITKYDQLLQEAHNEARSKTIIYALAFWQGYRMFASGEIASVGTVFTVAFCVLIAASTSSAIGPQFTTFANASASASELFEIMDKPSLLDPLSRVGQLPMVCSGKINFRDVTFAYPSRPSVKVLNSLNLSVPAGKTTALVGASGCGKSTLVGLIERWYETSSGSIELDGISITECNTQWLRSQIGLVQQEPVLFQGTIFQNIANGFSEGQKDLGKEEQIELVQAASKTCNAHEFIIAFPQGYFTEVGEAAGLLSGGQRQRIAIARSIVSDPRILLLDEATSALDPKAEVIVQQALDRASAQRTTLVIAHKLATIKNADNIAVISHGQVVEQGTHNELVMLNGHYARLVAAQDIGGTYENDAASTGSDLTLSKTAESRQATLKKYPTSGALEEQLSPVTQKNGVSLNYSLFRCIGIMLLEQKSLYIYFLAAGIACLIAGVTYPGQALVFARIFRVFTLEKNEGQSEANFLALMFFVIALGNLLAYFTIGVVCNIIGQELTHKYRKEMFTNILRQDMEFFDLPGNSSGALTSKLSTLPTQLQEIISANLLLIFIIFVNLTSSCILALAYGWKLALVVIFGGLPPLFIAGSIRLRLEMISDAKTSDLFSESANIASEAVLAIKTVSSLTLESSVLERYSCLLRDIVQRSIGTLLWALAWNALSQSLDFLIMALGFWYGSKLLVEGEYTVTQFYIIFIGVLFAGQAAAQFFTFSLTISQARGAANYILGLRAQKPSMQENFSNHDVKPSAEKGEICLSSMSFQYPGAKAQVIRNICMSIKLGQFIAFVGPSGCGKSTMISLLERFYDPTSGEIQFGGQVIDRFSPRLYRENFSLVQQEPTLYSGSIFENVSLGLEEIATNEQVLDACRQANALEFIDSLPEGLQTACGNRGLQFSGGQKQRIAIARALIRKPRVLLLDEATSALDTQSERIVQEALDKAKKGRTTIAVAHRLSTIKHADVIFVFGEGRVVEQGNHSELYAKKGVYYEMCLAQSLDKEV